MYYNAYCDTITVRYSPTTTSHTHDASRVIPHVFEAWREP